MAIERIEVTLPAELAEFAKSLVDGDDFASLDDVIVHALYHFRHIVEAEGRAEERLRADIQEGVDAADRGDKVDGPTFMRELLARSRKRAGQVS